MKKTIITRLAVYFVNKLLEVYFGNQIKVVQQVVEEVEEEAKSSKHKLSSTQKYNRATKKVASLVPDVPKNARNLAIELAVAKLKP